MAAGVDSIGATELIRMLSDTFSTDLDATALFDYPTIGSMTKYILARTQWVENQECGISPIQVSSISKDNLRIIPFVMTFASQLPTAERGCQTSEVDGLTKGGCVTS